MFGNKAYRIESLEKRIHELEKKNTELRVELIKHRAHIDELECENKDLKEELAKIKPVIETSGFKPAVTDKCDQCKYAYYSDYDNELLGCCKDAVCEDFESTIVKTEE